MPWHVVGESAQCPTSKPWAVIKDADGSVAGCHPTKAEANKQLAALYANEGSMNSSHPVDNLVRAWASPASLRAKPDTAGDTMVGHFAVFNSWTEIDSWAEGRFLEQVAPGAFKETFRARGDQIRVLYDHGADPMIGNKPLGTPTTLREDRTGAYYEVDLFDASYVNDLKPAIHAGQLGSSFRFRVTEEIWDSTGVKSDYNPEGLDERTITGVELYEFGPVTFPAYPDATAGMRSRTDEFINHLRDPAFVARFTERAGLATTERILADLPPTAQPAPDESADGDPDDNRQQRSDYFDRKVAAFEQSTRTRTNHEPS